jgi:hypothetical protein
MMAPLVLAQLIEKGRHHVVGAVEIDGERRVPILAGIRIRYGAAPYDPGIVDEDRDRTEPPSDLGGHGIAPGTVGQVTGQARGLGTNSRRGALRGSGVYVDRDDTRPGSGHRTRDRLTDARPCPGNQSQPAVEQAIHNTWSFAPPPSPTKPCGAWSPLSCNAGEGAERSEAGEGYRAASTLRPCGRRGGGPAGWRARGPPPADRCAWSSAATSNPTRPRPSDNDDCSATGCG